MLSNPQETADLVTFTEEILNGKPIIFCAVQSFFIPEILCYAHETLS